MDLSSSRDGPDTSSCLVASINQLQHPDGRPDVRRRQEALDNLVRNLTPGEVLYLRPVLANRRSGIYRYFKTFEHLPAELINMIANDLELVDIASCIRVNKAWHALWTSNYVVHGLLRHFFTGLLQTMQARNAMPPIAWDLFQQAAHRRWRTQCGNFGTKRITPNRIHLRYSTSHTEIREMGDRGPMYSSGRVVWQKDGRHFFIDNINTMERQLFSWPEGRLSGTELCLIATTEKLVILTGEKEAPRRRIMYVQALPFFDEARGPFESRLTWESRPRVVYHIGENQFRSVSLPSRIKFLHADGLNIGLHLYGSRANDTGPKSNNVVYIWRWSGSLEKVQPSQNSLEHVSNPMDLVPQGFLYHPFDKDIFSVVWEVREHKSNELPCASWQRNIEFLLEIDSDEHDSDYDSDDYGSDYKVPLHILTVLIDEYRHGDPLLCTRHSYLEEIIPASNITEGIYGMEWCQETDSHGGYVLCDFKQYHRFGDRHPLDEYVMFNTVERRFAVRTNGAVHFPQDTLYTPWNARLQDTLAVDTRRDLEHSTPRISLTKQATILSRVDEEWASDIKNDPWRHVMACDDEFMVVCDTEKHKKGYVVWGYGRQLREES